jgi:hypothetical protein
MQVGELSMAVGAASLASTRRRRSDAAVHKSLSRLLAAMGIAASKTKSLYSVDGPGNVERASCVRIAV